MRKCSRKPQAAREGDCWREMRKGCREKGAGKPRGGEGEGGMAENAGERRRERKEGRGDIREKYEGVFRAQGPFSRIPGALPGVFRL